MNWKPFLTLSHLNIYLVSTDLQKQKIRWHPRGKWLIHGHKHCKDKQSQTRNLST